MKHGGHKPGVTADGARSVKWDAGLEALNASRRGSYVASKLMFSFPVCTSRISSRERDGAREEGEG